MGRNSGKNNICRECKVGYYDFIPPDYYSEPPKPPYYKCRICGNSRKSIEDLTDEDNCV